VKLAAIVEENHPLIGTAEASSERIERASEHQVRIELVECPPLA
jgi:hypothetical protein